MRIRTLLAATVAFGAGTSSLVMAPSEALAQPAVDESPDAPPEAAAELEAPAVAAPAVAAPAVGTGRRVRGGAPARPEAASAEPEAPPAAPEGAEAEAPPAEAEAPPAEAETPEPEAAEAAPGALDPATAQALEDGLPSWEPAPVAPGAVTVGGGGDLQANWDAADGPASKVSYPWVESHGYYRMRADLFHNLDLDTYDAGSSRGSSPVLPPLTELTGRGSPNPEDAARNHRYKRGADTLASTNIRLRYQPTLHISENLRVKTTLDVLDNLVLGSTPDGGGIGGARSVTSRPDVPLESLGDGQRPVESGVNGYRDAVRVKHLWGEWKTPLGLLTFGRMQAHWGLGMLQNSGNCLDCDFGDSVDRIMGVTKLFGTYVAAAWDFQSEGLTGFPGEHNNLNQGLGQARDLDQRDDVNQYMVSFFSKPVTREEQEVRKRDLDELHKPVFDWGVYSLIRHQLFATETNSSLTAPPLDANDVSLMDAKMFAFIPDLWLDFQYHPDRTTKYRVQFEAAAVIGSIDEVSTLGVQGRDGTTCLDDTITNIADCPADQRISPRSRDLMQFGYTLQFDAQLDRLKWGMHQGLASGDASGGFGILDRSPLDSNDLNDQKISNFRFDRDFIVDLILFREILGGVTNAAYFKPYVGYNFIQDEREAWGFQVATIYSMALVPESTPGNARNLGLEFDFELYIHEFDRFRWSLAYGVLVPMGGLNLLNENRTQVLAEPGVAQTLQMNIGMQF